MKTKSKIFFIEEDQWEKFAESLIGQPVIYKNCEIMYDSLRVTGYTKAHTLCNFTLQLCRMLKSEHIWKSFVKNGLLNDL